MKEPLIENLVVHHSTSSLYSSRRILFVSVLINLVTILTCLLIVAAFYPIYEPTGEESTAESSSPLFANGLSTQLRLNQNRTIFDLELKSFEFKSSLSDDGFSHLRGSFARRIDLDRDYKRVVTSRLSENTQRVKFYPKHPETAAEIELTASVHDTQDDDIVCSSFTWQSNRPGEQDYEDCVDLTGAFWFGQSEAYTQYWPINNATTDNQYRPYLTGLFDDYSSVIERYWLSTTGAALIVNQAVPLFVQKNSTQLCLLCNYLIC